MANRDGDLRQPEAEVCTTEGSRQDLMRQDAVAALGLSDEPLCTSCVVPQMAIHSTILRWRDL